MSNKPVIQTTNEDKEADNRINQSTADSFEEVVKVDQFATQIFNWHVHLTNQMKHALNMPREQDGGMIAIVVYDPKHPDSHGYGADEEDPVS